MIRGGCCKGLNLNKNTKIWLNYLIGTTISAVLLWGIYAQAQKQFSQVDSDAWLGSGISFYLILCILLMPVNLGIETCKWKILASSAQPISYKESLKSLLGGIAISLITPNRIGEYPGRILYLQPKNTIRLISVSVLGAFAQFVNLFLFGIMGLIFYNIHFPGDWQKMVLAGSVLVFLFTVVVFFRFEYMAKYFEHLSWFRRFNTYSYLLKRFTLKEQLTILGLSGIRFMVFTAQYLILLRWMNITFSPVEGFCMAALFFWAIAVIPSIALAELGIRGQVSLFLFHNFSENTIGILAATIGLWCINLVIPAIVGSILLIRMRLLR